jgi:sugar phosphate permease
MFPKFMNKVKSLLPSLPSISKNTSNSILHNRVLLYALLAVALIDVLYLLNTRDFTSVIVFILVAVLTTFFSKNMIIVLFVAICITYMLKHTKSLEGLEDMEEGEDEEIEIKEDENFEEKEKEEEIEVSTEQMTGEMKEFMEVQDKIIKRMSELEPLMQRAEGFIEKFEKYK